MPLVQGRFNKDFSGIEYADCVDAVPDLTFPPIDRANKGIPDFRFPSTDSGVVVQPLVDENKSVGVLSRIRGWFR